MTRRPRRGPTSLGMARHRGPRAGSRPRRVPPTTRSACATVAPVRRPLGAWRRLAVGLGQEAGHLVAPVRRPLGAWRLVAPATALAAAGCELPNFGAPDPKAEEGEHIFSLWQGFFVASIGVALLVWGLIIYSVVRFRRRRDDEMPRQKPYNIPMEVLYTGTPIVAVALLFAFSVATEDEATDLRPDPAERVEVIGFQWSWQFVYPDHDVVVTGAPGRPPEMVLPVGETTHLRLVADDVNHAFWVPDFLSKR